MFALFSERIALPSGENSYPLCSIVPLVEYPGSSNSNIPLSNRLTSSNSILPYHTVVNAQYTGNSAQHSTLYSLPANMPPSSYKFKADGDYNNNGSFSALGFYTRLPHHLFSSLFPHDSVSTFAVKRVYKKVANKVKPVATTLPEDFRIRRFRPKDPLANLPPVLIHPPPFKPGSRLTQERLDALELNKHRFLSEEEVRFLTHILLNHESVLAWDETERGQFKSSYFEPVRIPTIEHEPWAYKNIPIPPGILTRVIGMIKDKIRAGVYEPSSSSYRSRWFCVLKKDGESLRIVHDLQPLNAVTIKDAGLPPIADHFIEGFAGRSCYSLFDLFVGYDHRELDEASRDLTTVQTPIGPLRLTKLPMGWTNSVAIFHGDTVWILQDEIPQTCNVFIDDVGVKGPAVRDETPIPENPGIRQFVYQHGIDCNRILHRLGDAGATVSAPKMQLCVPEVVILGHVCSIEGRKPDPSSVRKIKDWPVPKTLTQLRSFLGTVGYVRIWIRGYSAIARPLTRLLKKDVPFIWTDECQESMDSIKQAIIHSPALRPISYDSPHEVIVSVDSSNIAVGYILSQLDDDGKRRHARFGSIAWNERESKYSQAKIELYGLFRALHALKIYIIGVRNLAVEMDASYIKGMINRPDIHPVAVINRWIAAVKLFDFNLRHVPATKMPATDGLSRREKSPEESSEESDAEEWLDSKLESSLMYLENEAGGKHVPPNTQLPVLAVTRKDTLPLPYTDVSKAKDERLRLIHVFLKTLELPATISKEERAKLLKEAAGYFVLDGRLYRRDRRGRHQRVVPYEDRSALLKQAHDELGHRGFLPVRKLLMDRFWWPGIAEDIRWFLKTCFQCQIRTFFKLHLPPAVSQTPSLFQKVYIDTMFMPKSNGCRYLVQARCALTSYVEWRALKRETQRTLAAFIFEEIICRWGCLVELVTDNGKAFVAACTHLADKFNLKHIRISPYNSQANGPVERTHRDFRESLIKACNGDASKWTTVAPYVAWADRVTTRRATGHSPYFMAHGVEPVLPFDVSEATYLFPHPSNILSTQELIAIRARQLMKREDDIAHYQQQISQRRILSAQAYERKYARNIKNYDFKPGHLVLIRNKRLDNSLDKKVLPRYNGPYIVVAQRQNGSYQVAELDGTVSKLRIAASRVIPFHHRLHSLPPPIPLPDEPELEESSIKPGDEEEEDSLTEDSQF
jgi:transposase InsO family protein